MFRAECSPYNFSFSRMCTLNFPFLSKSYWLPLIFLIFLFLAFELYFWLYWFRVFFVPQNKLPFYLCSTANAIASWHFTSLTCGLPVSHVGKRALHVTSMISKVCVGFASFIFLRGGPKIVEIRIDRRLTIFECFFCVVQFPLDILEKWNSFSKVRYFYAQLSVPFPSLVLRGLPFGSNLRISVKNFSFFGFILSFC